MLTDFVVYHLASGQAFFSGAGLILVAVGLSRFAERGWVRRCRNLSAAVGVILVSASATPFSAVAYSLLATFTLSWLVCEWLVRVPPRWRKAARAVAAVAWIGAVLCEIPFHCVPVVPRIARPALGILGDSLTAGIGESQAVTWPGVLAESRKIRIRDHALAGARVGSARQQAAALTAEETLVLLEIGGNDLLANTAPREFERGLNELLRAVCQPGRTVVMFELPLPPSYNQFGIIQRRCSRAHGVLLIPKRVLLGVLRADATTLDSIHLSPAGHQRMAQAVWRVIHPAFDDEPAIQQRPVGE